MFFYLITFVMNLWHGKFVAADVTVVFVNNQHDIQRRDQDFDKKFYLQSVSGMIRYFKHQKYQNLRMNKKFEAIKMQLVCISAISAEYLQKICIFNFPR